jgi:hypothetical protein
MREKELEGQERFRIKPEKADGYSVLHGYTEEDDDLQLQPREVDTNERAIRAKMIRESQMTSNDYSGNRPKLYTGESNAMRDKLRNMGAGTTSRFNAVPGVALEKPRVHRPGPLLGFPDRISVARGDNMAMMKQEALDNERAGGNFPAFGHYSFAAGLPGNIYMKGNLAPKRDVNEDEE